MDASELLSHLVSVLSQTAGATNLSFDAQQANLTFQQGTSLAIIINELVSNAVKHGKGAVTMYFRVEEKHAILEVLDDGPGFSEDFSPTQSSHTGLELVTNLVRFDFCGAASIFKTVPREARACG
jgi:two-component sensor histidine kinase